MKRIGYASWFIVAVLIAVTPVNAFARMEWTFRNPPEEARPWTFWFWINGNISKDGITADLEAMERVGIGGVLIMEVANPQNMAPEGKVKFASPEWFAMFEHVLQEAERLGLQVTMNNDAGWCGSGGPWMTAEQSMKQIASTSTVVMGPAKIDVVLSQPESIEGFYQDIAVFAVPHGSSRTAVADNQSTEPQGIQLTDLMTSEGRITWDAPAGEWQLVRVGYTSTGRTNKPAPESGRGLEADKFDPDAIATHFNAFIGKLADQNPELTSSTFASTHIDSWEVGSQSWTADFAQEFQKRRGYDVMPWLPVLAGKKVSEAELAGRFHYDFIRTCSELNDKNYAGAMRELANAKGLQLSIEAYGQTPWLNPLSYGAEADVPVSEFWIGRWDAWHLLSSRLMASVSHVFGKQITAAESFTSFPGKDPFTEHPFSVKTIGDWAMSEGVNRIIFHRTVHDPWPGTTILPGMSFAGFGWHVDRNQTWFEQSKPFMNYLARCQMILQSGTFVADVVRLVTDGETRGNTPGMHRIPKQYDAIPDGYNYDYISDRALLSEMSVRDGKLVTRGGMTYAVMQLPKYTTMTVELAQKIKELVNDGAVILGPKPVRSPSLTNYPICDEQLRAIADKAWDTTAQRHVIDSENIGNILEKQKLAPDFTFQIDPPVTRNSIKSITGRNEPDAKGEPAMLMPTAGLNWIHRRLPEGDFYFVANPQHREVNALCTFRVEGMIPEIWYPETGEVKKPVIYRTDEYLKLPIKFGPAQSVFVAFRNKQVGWPNIVSVKKDGDVVFGESTSVREVPQVWQQGDSVVVEESTSPSQYVLEYKDGLIKSSKHLPELPEETVIEGPWNVTFPPGRGAPSSTKFFDLVDWSNHEEPGIRYFSGTAVYTNTFDWNTSSPRLTHWMMDLGDVQVMAEVRLNGEELGVLWKKPYAIDVTKYLKPGRNELEIRVTNLWVNRMIGDEQFPDDCTPNGSWLRGPLKAWPDWILNKTERPDPRRITFTTFKHYQKNSPLVPSGLMGPVTLKPVLNILPSRDNWQFNR